MTWKEAIHDWRLMAMFIVSLAGIALLGIFIQDYFQVIIQPKRGIQFNDWILNRIPSMDCSQAIFITMYATILHTVLVHIRKPEVIVYGVIIYFVATLTRMITIYVFTLEAPQGLIDMGDPFLSNLIYPPAFTKDLFFSGHVSTMVIMILLEPVRIAKWFKMMATTAVAVMLLLQHIHYTIDIVFAPVITLGIYQTFMWIRKPQTN